ncbi:MAG: hypothetical protein ACFFCI_24245, partial [Promethearchaeota archaeon]
PYLLIKVQDYLKLRAKKPKFFMKYKEVFIDPGVYELVKSDKYSWEGILDIREFLDSLPPNHYFAADYPCDMNLKFTARFLDKSWTNALKYCWHPHYIVTVQSQFNDYWHFTQWFDRYNNLNIVSGILALGNLFGINFLTEFMKHALDYAFSHCNHPRIHVYGLGKNNILHAYKLAKHFKIKLSIDSTKWTRMTCANDLRYTEGLSCSSKNRQKYFDVYLESLESIGIELE